MHGVIGNLGTREGQIAHYAAVKARLRCMTTPKVVPVVIQIAPVRGRPPIPVRHDEILASYLAGLARQADAEARAIHKADISYVASITAKFRQVKTPQQSFAKMAAVIREVCAKHGLTVEQVMKRDRHGPIVRARQEFFYRAKHDCGKSLSETGNFFGGLDHTTVLHGIRAHEKRMNQHG